MTASADKPRVRVAAATADSVQNFIARVGAGTQNQGAATHYGLNPITRNRLQLEWAYRGSWICRQVVDAPAEDMTRAGVEIQSSADPGEVEQLQTAMQQLAIWQKLKEVATWARLYGGAIGIMMIDGQNPATPLRAETVGKDQFLGLLAVDRWAVQPNFTDLITEFGPDFGMPRFYSVTASYTNLPRIKVHHSRVIRMEGEDLPIWQKFTENGWGLSVLEPLWDRLTAFDSTTVGVSQLVYKAHLRTLRIEGLREALGSSGPALRGILSNVDMIRAMQTNEGLTLLDKDDEFATHQYSFGGLSDVLMQFAQQLAGAAKIPLVRLFGQSPAGLNATGDGDIRNYYDAILSEQEARYRRPLTVLLRILHQSVLGKPPPKGFTFVFRPLWQMSAKERSEIGISVTNAVGAMESAGIITRAMALKELRQAAPVTGLFGSITDQDIEEAKAEPPAPGEIDLPEPPNPSAIDPVSTDPVTIETEQEGAPPKRTGDTALLS